MRDVFDAMSERPASARPRTEAEIAELRAAMLSDIASADDAEKGAVLPPVGGGSLAPFLILAGLVLAVVLMNVI